MPNPARRSAYRNAGDALDVKAALRERGHRITDEAALDLVHTWHDTNGGPTAMCRALLFADVHPFNEPRTPAQQECWYGDLDAVWAALGRSASPATTAEPVADLIFNDPTAAGSAPESGATP